MAKRDLSEVIDEVLSLDDAQIKDLLKALKANGYTLKVPKKKKKRKIAEKQHIDWMTVLPKFPSMSKSGKRSIVKALEGSSIDVAFDASWIPKKTRSSAPVSPMLVMQHSMVEESSTDFALALYVYNIVL